MRYFFSIYLFILIIPLFSQVTPILPESNNDLIYQEGEGAVVTNFSTQPTLNYSASGKRTLQLNTYKGNYNNSPYFSKYILYIPEDGVYNFWYSGTPPGTREDIFPSYSSPFTLIIDNEEYGLYREDVNVIESYAPGLYWIKTVEMELKSGFHEIEFRVDSKRRFDGKYYFYLDSFFLFKGDETSPGLTPEIFPSNMLNRSIDNAFRDIATYQANIRENPESAGNYLSLAHIYILIGDYLNSIKMLTRVLQLEPENRSAKLLLAKSRLWNGNIDQGIRSYTEYLALYPNSLSIWEEAGKVSAWLGKLEESIHIYNNALEIFPENSSLKVNKAFTHFWKGDIEEGLSLLGEVENLVESSSSAIVELANIYRVNGYNNYAIDLYNSSIISNPDFIELYLNLEALYHETGDSTAAENILNRIKEHFSISEQLQQILDTNSLKSSVKEQFISTLEAKLVLDPENLNLRELLVQTLFWNGYVDRSIDEYISIMTINNYQDHRIFDDNSHDIYYYYDILHYMENTFSQRIDRLNEYKQGYYDDVLSYRSAIRKGVGIEEKKELLEERLNATNSIYISNDYYYSLYDTLEDEIIELKVAEDERHVTFLRTLDGRWTLNRELFLSELKSGLEKESVKEFSSYILSLYYLIIEESDDLNSVISNLNIYSSWNRLLNYHKSLWVDSSTEYDLRELQIYYPFIEQLVEVISREGDLYTEPVTVVPEGIEKLHPYLERVDREQQKIDIFLEVVEKSRKTVKEMLKNRLIRTIYRHQENTNLLRYTIGDYYLQDGSYSSALEQFSLINSLDPFNISAQFKLGRVQQLTGDWKGALDSYADVFNIDPGYENASTMHNQLSLQHPENSSVNITYFSDPNMITFKEVFQTQFNLSSWYHIDPVWTVSTLSLLDWPPLRYRVDSIVIQNVISLNNELLTISPNIGVLLYNTSFDSRSPFEILDFSAITGTTDYYPDLSAVLNLTLSPYTFSINFKKSTLEESIPDSIKTIDFIEHSYSIGGYYPISRSKRWNSLAFRSYINFKHLYAYNHSNTMLTYAQDITSNIQISRSPWTTLTLYNTTTYENSIEQDDEIYYTPDSVFVSKLGGTISSFLGVNEGVMGLLFRLGAGVYTEEFTTDNISSFAADGDIEVNYMRDNRTIFLKAYGSIALQDINDPEYWALQYSLGFKISLSKLLTH